MPENSLILTGIQSNLYKNRDKVIIHYSNINKVWREVLKTATCGLGFQHLPQDLTNVNS